MKLLMKSVYCEIINISLCLWHFSSKAHDLSGLVRSKTDEEKSSHDAKPVATERSVSSEQHEESGVTQEAAHYQYDTPQSYSTAHHQYDPQAVSHAYQPDTSQQYATGYQLAASQPQAHGSFPSAYVVQGAPVGQFSVPQPNVGFPIRGWLPPNPNHPHGPPPPHWPGTSQ